MPRRREHIVRLRHIISKAIPVITVLISHHFKAAKRYDEAGISNTLKHMLMSALLPAEGIPVPNNPWRERAGKTMFETKFKKYVIGF